MVIGLFRSQKEAPSSEKKTCPVTLLVISGDKAEKIRDLLRVHVDEKVSSS